MDHSTYFLAEKDISPVSMYYVTVSKLEEAEKIANALLDGKLVACVNIVGKDDNPVTSMYTWEGKREKSSELLLLMKSRTALLPEIVATVKKNHSYTCPEVVCTPILGGNPDYIKWVMDETKKN